MKIGPITEKKKVSLQSSDVFINSYHGDKDM